MDDGFYYVSPSGKVVIRMGLPEGEIARLRAENERLTKERDALFLENGKLANTLGAECLRLRAALKPLAAIPLWTDTYPDGPEMDPTGRLLITAADVKAARRALSIEQKEPTT